MDAKKSQEIFEIEFLDGCKGFRVGNKIGRGKNKKEVFEIAYDDSGWIDIFVLSPDSLELHSSHNIKIISSIYYKP